MRKNLAAERPDDEKTGADALVALDAQFQDMTAPAKSTVELPPRRTVPAHTAAYIVVDGVDVTPDRAVVIVLQVLKSEEYSQIRLRLPVGQAMTLQASLNEALG